MMTQKKLALVVAYGQSNENGPGCKWGTTSVTPDNTTVSVRVTPQYGFPNYFGASGQSSMFALLAENIAARKGWYVKWKNLAVGGTGIISNWTGYTGAVVTGTPYAYGDVGFDPNNYVSGMVTAIQTLKAQGFEVWNITAGHQTDLSELWSADKISQAQVTVINRALSAGADKVMIGITPPYIGGSTAAEWTNPTGKLFVARSQTIATLANPNVFAGADLSVMTDTAVGMDSNLHRNHAGMQVAAGIWRDYLIDQGLI